MKWAAAANGVPSAVVNTHSMRAGGATALFQAGLDWITIQRWGRWRSFIFYEYVWRDAAAFLNLGERIASTSGLNKYLVEVAPLHTPPAKEIPAFHTGRADERIFNGVNNLVLSLGKIFTHIDDAVVSVGIATDHECGFPTRLVANTRKYPHIPKDLLVFRPTRVLTNHSTSSHTYYSFFFANYVTYLVFCLDVTWCGRYWCSLSTDLQL